MQLLKMISRIKFSPILVLVALAGCSNQPAVSDQFELLSPATQTPPPQSISSEQSELTERGGYLVELLGCGSCHTHGALEGEPDFARHLAGSSTGISYSNPLTEKYPGVVYPANITPHDETGIGRWNEEQIVRAIKQGVGASGQRHLPVMPWPAYAKLKDEDARAIAAYLLGIPAVEHRVPKNVSPGRRAKSPFVHFGVYRSK